MSQLLNKKYNLINVQKTVHKDKIYNERKSAKKLYDHAIKIMDKVSKKPYFKRRKLSKDKLKIALNFELKDIMNDLDYIIQHHRYTKSAKKNAIQRKKWIKERMDLMINIGIDQ